MVVDNRYLDAINKVNKKKGGKQFTIVDLLNMSYYSTPVQGIVRS